MIEKPADQENEEAAAGPAPSLDEQPDDELPANERGRLVAHAARSALSEEDDLVAVVEALIFAAAEPVPIAKLCQALSRVDEARINAAIGEVARRCAEEGRPYELAELAGGYCFLTRPEFAPYIAALRKSRERERLSPAALETLAVVAYRQPVTRAEIEAIRGVQSGPMLRTLLDRRLVRITGRAEVLGRPLQYGTTKKFMDFFGLASLKDLPRLEELKGP